MTTMPTQRKPAHWRWMIRRDMDEILEIENLCFQYPFTEDDFIRTLRVRNCIGCVLDLQDRVVSYAIYEQQKNRLDLLNLAVLPRVQRQGLGRQMIDKLKGKLALHYRRSILACVREGNLDAQLFFKANGFRCVNVLHDYYDDTDEDALAMEYRI